MATAASRLTAHAAHSPLCDSHDVVYAGAAAAAAPVAVLATGVAAPAEAELPAGAVMGLGSHGECTVGSSSLASAFFFDVFSLLAFCARLPGSESVSSCVHGLLIAGFSVLFVLVCFTLALAMGFHCHLLPVVSAFTAASLRSLSFSFSVMHFLAFSSHPDHVSLRKTERNR